MVTRTRLIVTLYVLVDGHVGCLMTIGSIFSSFALFRARKRDLTDEGSEAWASCRQTDRQPEMVGHVHVVLGAAASCWSNSARIKAYCTPTWSTVGFYFLNTVLRVSLFLIRVTVRFVVQLYSVQCTMQQRVVV